MTDNVGRKHIADLAEQRARTSDAHAKVVKKFRVQIRADAWLVGHEEVEQRGMNLPGADVRTDRWRQIYAEAVRGRLAPVRQSCCSITPSGPSGHGSMPGRLSMTGTSRSNISS